MKRTEQQSRKKQPVVAATARALGAAPRVLLLGALTLTLGSGVLLLPGCGGGGGKGVLSPSSNSATSRVIVTINWPSAQEIAAAAADPSRHVPANAATVLIDIVTAAGNSVGISATAVKGQNTVTLNNVPVGAGLVLKATAWSGQPNNSTQLAEAQKALDGTSTTGTPTFDSAPSLSLKSDVQSLGLSAPLPSSSTDATEQYARSVTLATDAATTLPLFGIPKNKKQAFTIAATAVNNAAVLLNASQDVKVTGIANPILGTDNQVTFAYDGTNATATVTLGLVDGYAVTNADYKFKLQFTDDVAIKDFHLQSTSTPSASDPVPTPDSQGLFAIAQDQGLRIAPTLTGPYTVTVYRVNPLDSSIKDVHKPFDLKTDGSGKPANSTSYSLVKPVKPGPDLVAPAKDVDGNYNGVKNADGTFTGPFTLRFPPTITYVVGSAVDGSDVVVSDSSGDADKPRSYQVVITSANGSGQAVIPITVNRASTANVNVPATVFKDSPAFDITTGSKDLVTATLTDPTGIVVTAAVPPAPPVPTPLLTKKDNTVFTFTPNVNMPTGQYTLTFNSLSLGGTVTRYLNVPSVAVSISAADGTSLSGTTAASPYTLISSTQRFVATVTGANNTNVVWTADKGTITSTGDFTPGFSATSGPTVPVYKLTATSFATQGATIPVSAVAYVTVAAGNVRPTIK